MKKIGCFRKEAEEFVGTITMLQFDIKARIVPIRHKPSAQSPDYIVFKIGETDFGAELGNAVLKYCIKQRVTYMVLSLDNPALQRAVEAILCEASDGLWYYIGIALGIGKI